MEEGESDRRPGNFDRAWNDPPLFSYDSTAAAAGGKTKLNKRVEFPLAASKAAAGKESSSSVASAAPVAAVAAKPSLVRPDAGAKQQSPLPPPPPPPTSSTTLPTINPSKEVENPLQEGPDLDRILSILSSELESSSLPDKKKHEVKKRLALMETRWRDGGLNDNVQKGLQKITACLSNESRDVGEAEKTQLSLMVDWPALCTPWLIGIKHLIVDVKQRREQQIE